MEQNEFFKSVHLPFSTFSHGEYPFPLSRSISRFGNEAELLTGHHIGHKSGTIFCSFCGLKSRLPIG